MADKNKQEVQKDVQGFMRTLIEDPQLALLFLKSPQKVAKRFSISITAKNAQKIKRALEAVRTGKFSGTVAGDCSWHDFPECHHVAHAANPAKDLIRPDATKMRRRVTKIVAADCSWHDFPECHHVAHAASPVDLIINPAVRVRRPRRKAVKVKRPRRK